MNTHTHHSTGAAFKKIVVAATLAACSGFAGAACKLMGDAFYRAACAAGVGDPSKIS